MQVTETFLTVINQLDYRRESSDKCLILNLLSRYTQNRGLWLVKPSKKTKLSLLLLRRLTLSLIRRAGWTAAEVEQSAQSMELPAALPRLQSAVVLQHPGGRERA